MGQMIFYVGIAFTAFCMVALLLVPRASWRWSPAIAPTSVP